MNILILMCDNRALDPNPETCGYWSLAAYINKKYADTHGYSFIYITPYYKTQTGSVYTCVDNLGNLRHASWSKVLLVKSKLKEYNYVVYIDTDCIFKNHFVKIEDLVKQKDFIFQSSAPFHKTLPCAGFFICKNTEENYNFLDFWYNYTVPANDSIEWKNTQKMAKELHSYEWKIDTHWEQDILWLFIANNKMNVEYNLLDEISSDENDTQFIRHIYSPRSSSRKPYFEKFIRSSGYTFENNIHTEIIDTFTL